jgi:hypothetical protein
MDDGGTSLKKLARAAIDSGRVPQTRAERPWGSSGDGGECAICTQVIGSQELGYELQFPQSEPKETPRYCQVHARCLKAWDAVRTEPNVEGP